MASNSAEYAAQFKSETKRIECKCPRCGKIHKKLLFWVGKTMPRKYCDSCNQKTNTYDQDAAAVVV